MIIPRPILKAVSRACDTASSRYALGSVLVQRNGDKCMAAATDGRRLVAAEWDRGQNNMNEGPPETVMPTESKTFSRLIPQSVVGLVQRLAKPTSSRNGKGKPRFDNLLISEATNDDSVSVTSRNTDQRDTIVSQAAVGRFPKVNEILHPEGGLPTGRTISMDARLLADTLLAVVEATPSGYEPNRVTIVVPDDKQEMVQIAREHGGVKCTAVIMPMHE